MAHGMIEDELQKQSTHRGPEIEDEDYERTVQRTTKASFDSWPNEAGFENLIVVEGPVTLQVKGIIPPWTAGTLYRVGPGAYNVPDLGKSCQVSHWFDGIGHAHRFEIIAPTTDSLNADSPVRVEYSSKRQMESLADTIKRYGDFPRFTFAQQWDPCVGIFAKLMSVWRYPIPPRVLDFNNVGVTVEVNLPGSMSTHGGEPEKGRIKSLWLTTDVNYLKEIDPVTMEAIGDAKHEDLHPLLKGSGTCAHIQHDPETGDMFNFNLDCGKTCVYRIFRTKAATGITDVLASISQPDAQPAYIHSFFLTPSFVVLCVPSTHLTWNGLKVIWARNILSSIKPFDESQKCRWFFVDRKHNLGVIASCTSPARFFFHSVNAFEELNNDAGQINVFCDSIDYPNTSIIHSFNMDVLMRKNDAAKTYWGNEFNTRSSQVRLTRHKFQIPLDPNAEAGKPVVVSAERIFEIKAPHVGELPTIDRRRATKKHRYIYSVANRGYSTLADTIVKTDIETREALFWDCPRGHTPGETVFIPRPENEEEDDGALLSVILDGLRKTSYLVCLNAKTMRELGRAECEWAIGLGFHGMHVPA